MRSPDEMTASSCGTCAPARGRHLRRSVRRLFTHFIGNNIGSRDLDQFFAYYVYHLVMWPFRRDEEAEAGQFSLGLICRSARDSALSWRKRAAVDPAMLADARPGYLAFVLVVDLAGGSSSTFATLGAPWSRRPLGGRLRSSSSYPEGRSQGSPRPIMLAVALAFEVILALPAIACSETLARRHRRLGIHADVSRSSASTCLGCHRRPEGDPAGLRMPSTRSKFVSCTKKSARSSASRGSFHRVLARPRQGRNSYRRAAGPRNLVRFRD